MNLGGIYHIETILMSLHHTRKPSALQKVGVKGSKIHLEYSLYSATIPDFLSGCVEVTHDATIICCSTLVDLACAKMSPLRPHRVERKTL